MLNNKWVDQGNNDNSKKTHTITTKGNYIMTRTKEMYITNIYVYLKF